MILKTLLVLAVIGIVYFLFIKKPRLGDTQEKGASKTDHKSEDMMACSRCGTYTSVSDSILKGGHYYCSSECLNG